MVNITATIDNHPATQGLCKLELWPPEQGSIKEVLPISLDLDFDTEKVGFPVGNYEIRASRATLKLNLVNADLVRGSRLGEYVNEPHLVAEVTQSVSIALESEINAQGRIEVEAKRGLFGRFIGLVTWKKRRSNRAEHDHVVKIESRIDRIIPRTSGRWTVVEPISPNLLTGRYIGKDGEREIGPLCLITVRNTSAAAQVIVITNRDDLDVRPANRGAFSGLSANKEATIAALVRRAIQPDIVSNFTLPTPITQGDIILGVSRMDIHIED